MAEDTHLLARGEDRWVGRPEGLPGSDIPELCPNFTPKCWTDPTPVDFLRLIAPNDPLDGRSGV